MNLSPDLQSAIVDALRAAAGKICPGCATNSPLVGDHHFGRLSAEPYICPATAERAVLVLVDAEQTK